jgi:hypothetical protein
MGRELKMPPDVSAREQFGFFDDFFWLISPHLWTNLAADAGVTAFAQSDAAGGVISGATGATDNNEIAIRTTNEVLLVAAGRPILLEARVQYAEAATNAANVAFGAGDALGADWLVDNGAGPRTSGNQVLIYKVDGETVWRAQARNGTGVTTSQSSTTAGGSAYQILRIEVKDMSTTQMTVTYSVDGVILKDSTTGQPINHQLNISGSTEMRVGLYAKAGGATSETVLCDYIGAYQVRY